MILESITDLITRHRTGDPEHGIPPHNAPELLSRWTPSMEVQINVDPAKGSPTDRHGVYEDAAFNRFWHFRIPKGADTDTPEFTNRSMGYPLPIYVASVGMTGWDWKSRVSRWVGFDFDALTHAAGITGKELERVKAAACALRWVESRNSSGGLGLHLYGMLNEIPTANHTEHAALAKVILGMMSKATGFDFGSRVDVAGGNMWFISNKATPENGGFRLIKTATATLSEADLPSDWRQGIKSDTAETTDAELSPDHQADLDKLRLSGFPPRHVPDQKCHQVHTKTLTLLDPTLQTNATGDFSSPNAFMRPYGNTWVVDRFNAAKDHKSWTHEPGRTWRILQHRYDIDLDFRNDAVPEPPQPDPESPSDFTPVSISTLYQRHTSLNTPIVYGLFRRAETVNTNAVSKAGKSTLIHGMCLHIITGRPWLGFDVTPGKILVIDNELHANLFASRIRAVAKALDIPESKYAHSLDVISLRGRLMDLSALGKNIISKIERDYYSVIVFDAFYRFLPTGSRGESDNSAMTESYNLIDSFAARTNAAINLIHHASKGRQDQKSVIDVGSGAGAMARAADCHIVLRPHELENHFVMEAEVRSFARPAPRVLRWDYPSWHVVDDVDPAALREPGRAKKQQQDTQAIDLIINALADNPSTINALSASLNIDYRRVHRVIHELVNTGRIAGEKAGRWDIYRVTA